MICGMIGFFYLSLPMCLVLGELVDFFFFAGDSAKSRKLAYYPVLVVPLNVFCLGFITLVTQQSQSSVQRVDEHVV